MNLDLHFLCDTPLPGRFAAAIQILKTAVACADRGHRVTVHHQGPTADRSAVFAYYGLPAASPVRLAVAFPETSEPRLVRRWAERRRRAAVVDALSQDVPTVIIGRGPAALDLLPAVPAMALRQGHGRPLLLWEMHNLLWLRHAEKTAGATLPEEPPDAASAALRRREQALLQKVDGLLCLTPAVADAVAQLAAGRVPPLTLLPSGTDPAPEGACPPRRFDVVYAGKIEPRKGLGDLVAAMAALPGRTLGIAGGPDAATEPLRRQARTIGVEDRITFAGLLPAAAVAGFLRSGAIGVCPLPLGIDSVSDRFTSPMKLIQMMSLGMAVVGTDIPPVRAIATDRHDALLAAPNAPDALAAAIACLLDDPGLAARLGAAAAQTAVQYAWSRRAATLERFVEDLLRERAA